MSQMTYGGQQDHDDDHNDDEYQRQFQPRGTKIAAEVTFVLVLWLELNNRYNVSRLENKE